MRDPPHSLSVHAPLTPSQRADGAKLSNSVLALLRAGVEGKIFPLHTQQTDDEWACVTETKRRCFSGMKRAYVSPPAFFPPLFRLQRSGQKWKADRSRKRFCQIFTTTARYTLVKTRLKVLGSQLKLHFSSTLFTSNKPKRCLYRKAFLS